MKFQFLILLCLTIFIQCRSTKNARGQIDIPKNNDLLHHMIKNDPVFKNHFVGIKIHSITQDKDIYNLNEELQFTPASNMKLITFYACLNILSDSITQFYYTSKGDSLFIVPNGDPSFLNSELDSIQNGYDFLNSTDSKLFITKNTKSDTSFYGNGWAWDDYNYTYQSCKSSFPIYGNNAEFVIKRNNDLQVIPSFFTKNLKTTKHVGGPILRRNENNNEFIFSYDTIPNNYKIRRPFLPFENTVLSLLRDTIKSSVQIIEDTFNTSSLKSFKSVSSKNLYKAALKRSDNFVAEQLLLMCSNKLFNYMSTKSAINYIQDSIFNNKYEMRWVDGSGLSRYNLASPQIFVQILKEVYHHYGFDNLKHILATGSEDDTLDKIFFDDTPWIFAKTGSLSNNYCLSGYLKTDKGNILTFSFLNNHFTSSRSEVIKSVHKFLYFIKSNY